MADNTKYIESHSSYVKSKFHQMTNDGNIIKERDWTTIGNIERHVPNQTPIYQSGNFIITVDNSINLNTDSPLSGEILENITLEGINLPNAESDDKIELNDNVYDLRTFAYYGSCTELIKATISNLIKTFPYELYFSDRYVYYQKLDENGDTIYGKYGDDLGLDLKLIINPSQLDLYSTIIKGGVNYLLTDLSKNYVFVNKNNEELSINEDIVFTYKDKNKCTENGKCIGKFQVIQDVTIYVYQGEGNSKIYLYNVNANLDSCSIRPTELDLTSESISQKHISTKEYFNKYYNSLDKFSQILINPTTDPKYSATFNVITPTDFGIKTIQKTFIFPRGDGEWNIGGDEEQFQDYLSDFFKISEYYDELYSDNMWRMMTHEAIKNFDWSFKKRIDEDLTEKHIEGGEKISKIIRLYGREFDEVKRYIDNIRFANNLNYQDNNTAINEALPSLLEMDGWSLKSFGDNYENEYVNFQKILRLNSRQILRHKGTIEGIEMLLSLFGLKSNRMVGEQGCDYKISEYIFNSVTPIVDNDKIEKVKTLNSEKDDFDIFNDDVYQGLSVIEYNGKLFPYYSKDKTYDNGLYYQMKGNWIDSSYKPMKIKNKNELGQIPYSSLFDKMIIKVEPDNGDPIEYYMFNINDKSFTKTTYNGQTYDLYDIHNGNNNYDDGMQYLQLMLNPIQYHLNNNLFNINNKDGNNIIINETATDIYFNNEEVTLDKLKPSNKIKLNYEMCEDNAKTEASYIEDSLKVINVKNILIKFNNLKLDKNILFFYLQQMIPSTIICKVEF